MPDDTPSGDKFGDCFDGGSGSETKPQNTEDEAGEIDELRCKDTGDDKEKSDCTCARKLPGDGIINQDQNRQNRLRTDRVVFSQRMAIRIVDSLLC